MTQTLKVLSQTVSVANTLIPAYTVGAIGATISSLTICNTDGYNPCVVSVSIAIGGASDTLSQYVYSWLPIGPTDTFAATLGLTVATGDVVRFWSNNNLAVMQLFGVEIT